MTVLITATRIIIIIIIIIQHLFEFGSPLNNEIKSTQLFNLHRKRNEDKIRDIL